jgi:hypothetical protein
MGGGRGVAYGLSGRAIMTTMPRTMVRRPITRNMICQLVKLDPVLGLVSSNLSSAKDEGMLMNRGNSRGKSLTSAGTRMTQEIQ